MDSGFYAACAGLRAQSQALEVAGHNLANLNTTGFRGQQTTFQSLLAVSGVTGSNVTRNVLNAAANNFGVLEGTHMDMTAGNLQSTGNPLDVGIEGEVFFQILTPRGMRYTRNGSFQVSSVGVLVTAAGDPVMGDPNLGPKGVINVPKGKIAIASDGTVSVNGAVAGSIQLAQFAPGTVLTAEGGTLIDAPAGSAQPPQKPWAVRQGTLESSNISSVSAVVSLISVQREADMLQHAMSLFDTEFNKVAASDLPRV